MGFHEFYNALNLRSTEAAASLKTNWTQPRLCAFFITLCMNVRWLTLISGVEEESIRAGR
jgi:hypothetical protein